MPISLVYLENSLVYSNALVLLAIGLTMTYLTTKIPNFAHGSLAIIGAYLLFTVVAVYKASIALGFLAAFLAGAAAGLLEYLLVLRPLQRRGTDALGLMIATLGVDIFLIGVLNIYADIVRGMNPVTGTSRDWSLRSFVLTRVAGLTEGTWISIGLVVFSLIALYLLLTRTKFGVAMRASIENPQLAQVLGVNVDLVYAISWLMAGGLAGLAGGLMSFVLRINPATGSLEVVSVFAASIVGGLQSLLGGVVGGYLVGLSETIGTRLLGELLGLTGITAYRKVVSLALIVVVLLVAPEGLMGVNWRKLLRRMRGKARKAEA